MLTTAFLVAAFLLVQEPKPFAYTLEKVDVGPAEGLVPDHKFQFRLRVDETGQEFPLASMYVLDTERWGLDENSLATQWLYPGKAVQIWWTTITEGAGQNLARGDIILIKDDSEWVEAFRNFRPYFARVGAGTYGGSSLEFAWLADDNAMRLTETTFGSERAEPGEPLAAPDPNDPESPYQRRKTNFVSQWDGRLRDGGFAFAEGRTFFRADAEVPAPPINELAAFLEERFKRSDVLAALLRLNPTLTAESPCPEQLLIDDEVPPFKQQPKEMTASYDNPDDR